jgi:ATP-dependent Clp protease adaptor protein ClpS
MVAMSTVSVGMVSIGTVSRSAVSLGAVSLGTVPHASTAPTEVEDPVDDVYISPDTPWIVLVWNDPINLMSYVTFVLQKLFGYSESKANKLMLDVHQKGRAVVSQGSREKAELDVFRLHEHGLWATMQQD